MDLTEFDDVLQQNCRIKKTYPKPGYETQMVDQMEVFDFEIIQRPEDGFVQGVIKMGCMPLSGLYLAVNKGVSGNHCLPHLCCYPEDVFASIERCKICDKHI